MKAHAKHETPVRSSSHRGEQIRKAANLLGVELLEWQTRAAAMITEHDRDGIPLRDQALITVPRQQGKSILVLSLILDVALEEPDRAIVYTAQTRTLATNRIKAFAKMARKNPKIPLENATFGSGNERVIFGNGSVLEVASPNEASIHGESVDLVICDEAWKVTPEFLEGALPAMAARERSIFVMVSTAGTLESELLNRYTELGRAGDTAELSFLEFSKPDTADLYDEEAWFGWMPALDQTTPIRKIRSAASSMTMGEFRRAYGNLTKAGEGHDLFDPGWWSRSLNDLVVPATGSVLAVDVSQSPSGASIAIAQLEGDELYHVELVEHRDSSAVSWIPPRVEELRARYDLQGIAIATNSPVGSIEPDLQAIAEQQSIPLRRMNQNDRAAADGFLVEQLRLEHVTHNRLEVFDAAIEGAQTKITPEDGWLVDRKRSYVDVSPWIAASMALRLCHELYVLAPTPGIF